MIIASVSLGVVAGGLLLVAGYLFGLARGNRERDALRQRLRARATELRFQLQGLTASLQERERSQRNLEVGMQQFLDRLSTAPSDAEHLRQDLQQMLAPILERDRNDQELREAVHHLLTPLMQREQLSQALAHLDLDEVEQANLPRLLDGIAERGRFAAVLLSDEAGLPLASNERAQHLDRLTGLCSLVMLLVDRLTRDGAPQPVAIVIRDVANQDVLCRVFDVSGQRLLLTAVAAGSNLTPTSLDPALASLEAALVRRSG